jgi:hypothetical protein
LAVFGFPLLLVVLYYRVFHLGEFGGYLGDPNSLLAFFTGLLTYYYVVITWSMVRRMAIAQENDRRPFVSVDFELENAMGYVVVHNHGLSPASDVRISFDPELVGTRMRKASEGLFAKPISFLPPGRERRSFIDSGSALLRKQAPVEYTATISYTWAERHRSYQETIVINLNFYKWKLSSPRADLKDIADQLEGLTEAVREIRRTRRP